MPAGFAAVRALRVSGTALAVLEGFEAQRPSGRRFVLPKQQLELGCLGDIFNLEVILGESAPSLPITYCTSGISSALLDYQTVMERYCRL